VVGTVQQGHFPKALPRVEQGYVFLPAVLRGYGNLDGAFDDDVHPVPVIILVKDNLPPLVPAIAQLAYEGLETLRLQVGEYGNLTQELHVNHLGPPKSRAGGALFGPAIS